MSTHFYISSVSPTYVPTAIGYQPCRAPMPYRYRSRFSTSWRLERRAPTTRYRCIPYFPLLPVAQKLMIAPFVVVLLLDGSLAGSILSITMWALDPPGGRAGGSFWEKRTIRKPHSPAFARLNEATRPTARVDNKHLQCEQ
uniref:Uncharacterized protein n=1 Tax=Anopheles farauti TaxID=69004 RepID=A0A182QS69_9DIPT